MKHKTSQGETYKTFYLKKRTWQYICERKRWTGRGSIARFASEIGITRQYARMISGGLVGCSSNVMRRIIDMLGYRAGECWCDLFEFHNIEGVDQNHPIWNQAKSLGEVPYTHYSDVADMRSQDYDVEKRSSDGANI